MLYKRLVALALVAVFAGGSSTPEDSECGCGSKTPMVINLIWQGTVLAKNSKYDDQNSQQTGHNPLKKYDWYFVPPKDGCPPSCPPR